jgi:hypothetical protein
VPTIVWLIYIIPLLKPPPTAAGYYKPLEAIQLPSITRFVAGFVHEKRTLADNKHILDSIGNARGQLVDVASSCGLGRRTADTALALLERTAYLAHS